jgi:ribosomal protein S27E
MRKPIFAEGELVIVQAPNGKPVTMTVEGTPFWNGFTWMYSFKDQDMSCGEHYLRIPLKEDALARELAKGTAPTRSTKKLKTALTTVAAVFVDCPDCGGAISHPTTGSHLWETNDPVFEKTLTCDDCGAKVMTPRTLVRKEGT